MADARTTPTVDPRFEPDSIDLTDVVGWARKTLAAGRYMTQNGYAVRNRVHGETILFHISDPDDFIQKHHMAGRFYEVEELRCIQQYLPFGGVYLDIGTNIGNHALYVAKFMRPNRVIVVEPNPIAIEGMIANFALNGLNQIIDVSALGVGIGDAGNGFGLATPKGNLGATQLVHGGGDTNVVSGDSLFADRTIHFIKIDVEGMEIQALNSLTETVKNSKPNMLVEVDPENRAQFQTWVNDMTYTVAKRFRQTRPYQNFLITPHTDTTGPFVPVTI